ADIRRQTTIRISRPRNRHVLEPREYEGEMTLLCLSSGVGVEGAVELAGDVALEDAADVAVGFAFGAAAGEVGMGAGAAAHPGERDGVQGVVEVPVAAAVEA